MNSPKSDAALMLVDQLQTALNESVAGKQSSQQSIQQQPLWTPELVQFLAVAMLMFTFGALLLGAILLWHTKASPSQVLRTIGVISIIGISALILVVGYSSEQLTPIVGLFGAIAGYLLGKENQPDRQDDATRPVQPSQTA